MDGLGAGVLESEVQCDLARPSRSPTSAEDRRGIGSAYHRSVGLPCNGRRCGEADKVAGFSPGGEPDFGAKSRDDPQAAVYHDFRGSWKIKGSE